MAAGAATKAAALLIKGTKVLCPVLNKVALKSVLAKFSEVLRLNK